MSVLYFANTRALPGCTFPFCALTYNQSKLRVSAKTQKWKTVADKSSITVLVFFSRNEFSIFLAYF